MPVFGNTLYFLRKEEASPRVNRRGEKGCQEFFKNALVRAQTSLVNFRENGREQFEAEAALQSVCAVLATLVNIIGG